MQIPKLEVKVIFCDVVQKMNESPFDCQDACSHNTELNRYAVADGVANSFYPREWAKMLVDYFCNENTQDNLTLFETKRWQNWLIPIQNQWGKLIKNKVNAKGGKTYYHLRNSLALGEPAAATFVGLQINMKDQISWQSMIIGDTCLFIIRDRVLGAICPLLSGFVLALQSKLLVS